MKSKPRRRRKRSPEQKAEAKKLKEWANGVKSQANFQCEWCGQKKYLNAHHIISKRYKPLRFELYNGLALCPRCHKFGIGVAAHENPIKVFLWLQKHRPEALAFLIAHLKEVM